MRFCCSRNSRTLRAITAGRCCPLAVIASGGQKRSSSFGPPLSLLRGTDDELPKAALQSPRASFALLADVYVRTHALHSIHSPLMFVVLQVNIRIEITGDIAVGKGPYLRNDVSSYFPSALFWCA